MADLSESELLLLNNFMYIQGSTSVSMTVEEIADEMLENGISEKQLSGGVTKEQAEQILKDIKKDPRLCDLEVKCSTDTDGVRAACFVDENNHATVAFRGTGGSYEAWKDNVLGEYQTDTKDQKQAADFINSCPYDNMTVTGHSKGGNLAQYCTVTCDDKVDRCVSYDGQGFNNGFIDKYAESIEKNSSKIKSICGDEDYVNILLTSIAGETRYMETTDGENAHSSIALYEENKDNLDADGNYSSFVEQSDMIRQLDDALNKFVDGLDQLPDNMKNAIVNMIGSDVGMIFAVVSGQVDLQSVGDWYTTQFLSKLTLKLYSNPVNYLAFTAGKAWNSFLNWITGGSYGSADFYVNLPAMKRQVQEIAAMEKEIGRLQDELGQIRLVGSLGRNAGIQMTLKYLQSELMRQRKSMGAMREALSGAAGCYQAAEFKCAAGAH